MARRGCPVRCGQDTELVVQTFKDLAGREHPGQACGQLDRQGHPVQSAADIRHRARVLLRERESACGCRPLGEKCDPRIFLGRGNAHPAIAAEVLQVRYRKRIDRPLGAFGQAQRLTTCHQHAYVGAPPHHRTDKFGAGRSHSLAVVEHKEQLPLAQEPGDHLQLVPRGGAVDSQCFHQRVRQQASVRQGRQVDEVHTVPEQPADLCRHPQGEPGLADATGPEQGDHPGTGQQLTHLADIPLPPDEARQFNRNPHGGPGLRSIPDFHD